MFVSLNGLSPEEKIQKLSEEMSEEDINQYYGVMVVPAKEEAADDAADNAEEAAPEGEEAAPEEEDSAGHGDDGGEADAVGVVDAESSAEYTAFVTSISEGQDPLERDIESSLTGSMAVEKQHGDRAEIISAEIIRLNEWAPPDDASLPPEQRALLLADVRREKQIAAATLEHHKNMVVLTEAWMESARTIQTAIEQSKATFAVSKLEADASKLEDAGTVEASSLTQRYVQETRLQEP